MNIPTDNDGIYIKSDAFSICIVLSWTLDYRVLKQMTVTFG